MKHKILPYKKSITNKIIECTYTHNKIIPIGKKCSLFEFDHCRTAMSNAVKCNTKDAMLKKVWSYRIANIMAFQPGKYNYWQSFSRIRAQYSRASIEQMIDKQAAHCKSVWAGWLRESRRFVALDFRHDRLPPIVHLNSLARERERGKNMGRGLWVELKLVGWNLCRYRCSEKRTTSAAAADAVADDDDALNNCSRRVCIAGTPIHWTRVYTHCRRRLIITKPAPYAEKHATRLHVYTHFLFAYARRN